MMKSTSKFNDYKSPFTQEEFDKRMQDKKITLADFKRDIRRSITVEKVLNKEVVFEDQRHRSGHHGLLQRAIRASSI